MSEILIPDWTTAKLVVPSDAVDNVVNAAYLHNRGTGGLVPIVFANGADVALYLPQGATLRGGKWRRVKASGLGAGVEVVGFW